MPPELGDTDLTVEHADPVIHTVPPGGLELDAPDGPHALGAPTVDSDADGHPDTTVTSDPALGTGGLGTGGLGAGVPGAGVLALASDLDGDGHVDVLTTLEADGTAHTVTFPAVHPWDEGVPPPPPVLDPADGGWTRLAD